jgi:hypothetical protein
MFKINIFEQHVKRDENERRKIRGMEYGSGARSWGGDMEWTGGLRPAGIINLVILERSEGSALLRKKADMPSAAKRINGLLPNLLAMSDKILRYALNDIFSDPKWRNSQNDISQ